MLVNPDDLVKKDTRDPKVTKDHPVLLVSKVLAVLLAPLVTMAHLVHEVHKDQWAKRENKVNAVIVVNKDELDYRVFPDPQDTREKLVMLEELVCPVKRVDRVNPAHKVPKAQLVCPVLLDNPVRLDLKVNLVNEDNLVHLETPVLEEPRETLDPEVKTVLPVPKVQLDQSVPLVKTVPKVIPVHLVCLVMLVILVNLADPVLTDQRENPEMMAEPEKSDNLVHKVTLDHRDPKVDVDLPGHPVQTEKKVKREPKVTAEIKVHLVYLDNLDLKVPLVKLVSTESVVYLDLSANLDYLVNLEAWENPDPLDQSVLRVPRVNPDLKVKRVTMVSSV